MIRSPSYAARLRREALRLMRDVWAQAEIVCTNHGRRSKELEARISIGVALSLKAQGILERLRKAGF